MKIFPFFAAATLAVLTSSATAQDSGADEMEHLPFKAGEFEAVTGGDCTTQLEGFLKSGLPHLGGDGVVLVQNTSTSLVNRGTDVERLLFIGPEQARTQQTSHLQRETNQKVLYTVAKFDVTKQHKKGRTKALVGDEVVTCDLNKVTATGACFARVTLGIGSNLETFDLVDLFDCDKNVIAPDRPAAQQVASLTHDELSTNYLNTGETCKAEIKDIIRANRGEKYNFTRKKGKRRGNKKVTPDAISGSGDTALYVMQSPWLWTTILKMAYMPEVPMTGMGLTTRDKPFLVGAKSVRFCKIHRNTTTLTKCVFEVGLNMQRKNILLDIDAHTFTFVPSSCPAL